MLPTTLHLRYFRCCWLITLFSLTWAQAQASYLYTVNRCERSITGFQIQKDGMLTHLPFSPLPSVAYYLQTDTTRAALYVANTGFAGQQLRSYSVSVQGDLNEINTDDTVGAFAAALALHPLGKAVYRSTDGAISTVELYFGLCLNAALLEGSDALWVHPLAKDGALLPAQSGAVDGVPDALAVDPDGEFAFVALEDSWLRKINTYRLDAEGRPEFPAAHAMPHYARPKAMITLVHNKQKYLLTSDGFTGLSVFIINQDGSLREAGPPIESRGGVPLALLAQKNSSAEQIIYVANFGDDFGGNNIAVFRFTDAAELTHLQTVPMPEEKGDPLYRRPHALAASSTHLYVANFGRVFGVVNEGSVLVYSISKDGTLAVPHIQESASLGRGTAALGIVHSK